MGLSAIIVRSSKKHGMARGSLIMRIRYASISHGVSSRGRGRLTTGEWTIFVGMLLRGYLTHGHTMCYPVAGPYGTTTILHSTTTTILLRTSYKIRYITDISLDSILPIA